MRRLFVLVLLAFGVVVNAGCQNCPWCCNCNKQSANLLNASEQNGPPGQETAKSAPANEVGNIWDRTFSRDQPSVLPPERVHGGIE